MNLKTTTVAGLLSLILFTACDEENNVADAPNGSGKANFYLTDAPIDDADVSAVVISVAKVEAKGPEGWETIEAFEEPVAIDLLSYQNGATFFLGDADIATGAYTEVRLVLSEQDSTGSAGCYLQYSDSSAVPLFTPSGSQSGYKIKGDFVISEGSETNVTLDFDVRKSVVKSGNSGKYILKPTIRLVANEDAGTIEGTIDAADSSKIIVFAYKDGAFSDVEIAEPAEGEVRFPNAVSSSVVEEGTFTLAFLAPGSYDLYFASVDSNGEFIELLGYHDNVNVQSGESVEIDVARDLLL